MLLELDADQRLWQETVRDAVGKRCPSSLVRSVAEDGADASPPWKVYVDAGWTELTEPENAVELAIVLEELGRATDPTPFLATLTQFAPLVGDRFDPQPAGTAVYGGVTAHRDADVVTTRRNEIFDPVLHVADVSLARVHLLDGDRLAVDAEKARHLALTGMAVTMVGACQRILDLALEHVKSRYQFGVPIGSFQAVQHKAVDMHVAIERARALSYFAALTIAGGVGAETLWLRGGDERVEQHPDRGRPRRVGDPATTGPYAHMNLDHYFGSWFERFARSFSGTIAGGTSEIQRNIIARQVLGLPRP
jgi:alkylation response protein AidB-like acyl-CoA dehydrogenase